MENSGFVFINLLPYRKKIKMFKVQQFSMLMGSFAFVGLVIVTLAHLFYAARIELQDSRNVFIENENKELDKKIKSIASLKDEIKLTLDKRRIVETLQSNRADGVNIINQVANNLPDGTALKTIKKDKDTVTIVGQTTSNNKVSNYMTALGATDTFKDPNLIEIKSVILVPVTQGNSSQSKNNLVQEIKANEFTITVKMRQSLEEIKNLVADAKKEEKKIQSNKASEGAK